MWTGRRKTGKLNSSDTLFLHEESNAIIRAAVAFVTVTTLPLVLAEKPIIRQVSVVATSHILLLAAAFKSTRGEGFFILRQRCGN